MLNSLMTHLTLYYPLLINSFMLIMMMLPNKLNKFHPMMLMLILIMITFLITLKMNFIHTSLMSFFLFLMMIGGLMIIYMYISSLSNNEKFSLNLNLIKLNMIKMLIFTMLMTTMYLINNKYMFNLQDLWNNMSLNIMYNQINISIIYKKMNYMSSIFIMWYLYFTMICVMNICYKNKLPLRQLIM